MPETDNNPLSQEPGRKIWRHLHREEGKFEWSAASPVVPPPNTLEMFVIYRSPEDFPGKFVVRRWLVSVDEAWVDTEPMAICDTLQEARDVIEPPRKRSNLGNFRSERDPAIFEVWM